MILVVVANKQKNTYIQSQITRNNDTGTTPPSPKKSHHTLTITSPFDTVDHTILLDFLKHYIGMDGTAFKLLVIFVGENSVCVY